MITIVEPQRHIADLWGKQSVDEQCTYRMMRYVLRVEHEGRVLLHNVVTGQLVVLSLAETSLLEQLPMQYNEVLKSLVDGHYLVSDQFDEYQQVVKIRKVLMMLDNAQRDPGYTTFTILPTTACNARCYYCFEQGAEIVTMSEVTGNDVINFVASNCGKQKKAFILWFGGEPTVAANRIDQICKGLQNCGVQYESDMISNGYLFDEEMVLRAKELWNLKHIQISVDGTEEKYNRTKAYVNPKDNPYQRVMRNVGLLLENGIRVGLRMNFDVENHDDFVELLHESERRFADKRLLNVNAYPVIGEYADKDGMVHHGTEEWFEEEYVQLNNMAREMGLNHNWRGLPFLKFVGCGACNQSSVTINAKGMLVRCPEQFDDTQMTGDVRQGITSKKLIRSWKELAEVQMCSECIYFPACIKLKNCNARENCYFQDRNYLYRQAVEQCFTEWIKNNESMGGM